MLKTKGPRTKYRLRPSDTRTKPRWRFRFGLTKFSDKTRADETDNIMRSPGGGRRGAGGWRWSLLTGDRDFQAWAPDARAWAPDDDRRGRVSHPVPVVVYGARALNYTSTGVTSVSVIPVLLPNQQRITSHSADRAKVSVTIFNPILEHARRLDFERTAPIVGVSSIFSHRSDV